MERFFFRNNQLSPKLARGHKKGYGIGTEIFKLRQSAFS